MSSRVHRFVSNDFSLRISAVNATEVVAKMQSLQSAMPIPTVAVGRVMVGALLLSSNLKDSQEVGILIKGNGALNSVYAQSSHEGKVRGYCSNSQYIPAKYDSELSLKPHIGNGYMTVVRHQPFQRQPYQGTVELVSGEIGDDIAFYLHQSQQIRSIISLGVSVDSFGRVQSVGGILIEVMPGVEQGIVDTLQKNYEEHKTVISQKLIEGTSPEELVKPYLKGFEITEIPHPYPMEYFCPCTKERVCEAVVLLGVDELSDMVQKQEVASITCEMCGRPYQLSVDELRAIRDNMVRESLH